LLTSRQWIGSLKNSVLSRCAKKGSHIFYRHRDGRTTTVPSHKGRDLARPLIREILREIELAPEQYQEELEKI
jgi:predicted RNA binding protein YcfA (HicA-like mRNA interferase family)